MRATQCYKIENVIEPLEGRRLLATTLSIGSTIPVAYRDIGSEGLIVISRGGDLSAPLSVPLSVSGTAVNGVDYGRIGGTATIPAGQRSVGLPIRVGSSSSPSNYLRVSINSTPDFKLNARTAVVNILQNPNSPSPLIRDYEITADPSTLNNGRRGMAGAFVIRRTTDLDTTVTVPISVGGTALNGSDFGYIGDRVTFLPGQDVVVLPIRTPGTVVGTRTINLSVATDGSMTSPTTFNLSGVTGVSGVATPTPRLGGLPGGSTIGVPPPSALPRDDDSIIDTGSLDPAIDSPTTSETINGIERVGTPLVDNGYGVLVPATRVFA